MGTYGSRSLTVGGIAIVNACKKIVNKGKRIAAKMLEASPDEVDFKNGEFVVAKSNKKKTIGEVAFASYLPGVRDEVKSPLPEGDEPALAFPVPFCFQGFLPPPRTSDLVFVDAKYLREFFI
mgnify:CR=1 FL=1